MKPISEWAQSEFGFYVDRRWRDGRWELQAGPIELADYHKRILAHVFTPGDDGRLPYDVVAWCEPAKSGKSAIAGLVGEYMALHGERNSSVIMAANTRNQASSLMYKSLTDSIEMNPHLPNVEPGKYEVEFANGNTVMAIPSNYRGQAGARFSLALFDEPWGMVYRDAERLWAEFKTDPTRVHSLKLAIGYAGFLESKLWLDLLQGGLAGGPVPELEDIDDGRGEPACWRNGRLFVFWSHLCRQPWQTEAWQAGQKATLSAAQFSRMVACDFVESEGDFLDFETWETLIGPDHVPLDPGSDKAVFVGLDVATKPRGDDCALIGVYPQDGQVKVAFHRIWKGGKERRAALRLSETVEPYIRKLARDYRVQGVYFDPFQALKLAEDLGRAGVRCIEVPQTHGSRGPKDTALWEMAVNGELVLYDDDQLRYAASYASAKELGNGLLFITKTGRGKIDLLIALSNCASEARQQQRALDPSLVERAVNLDAESAVTGAGDFAEWFTCDDVGRDYWMHVHLSSGVASLAMAHVQGEKRVEASFVGDRPGAGSDWHKAGYEFRPVIVFDLLHQMMGSGGDVRRFIRKLVEERKFSGLAGRPMKWDAWGVVVPESIEAGISFSGSIPGDMLPQLAEAGIHAQEMSLDEIFTMTLQEAMADHRIELPEYPRGDLLDCVAIAVYRIATTQSGGGWI